MFQTKFDRWLIENFIYEHHILVMKLPENLPSKIEVSEVQSMQYKYLLKIKDKKQADELIDQMRHEGSLFSTKIVEGNHWYSPVIFNKNKSFTFRVFWWAVVIILAIVATIYIRAFMDTEIYHTIKEDVKKVMGK